MPRPRGSGKGETARINIRLDAETEAFYKRKANREGKSVSQFLRELLVQGVVMDNVVEIDMRLRTAMDDAVNEARRIMQQRSMHAALEKSILEIHAMLVQIVEARDVQAVYRAQEIAKARMEKMRAEPMNLG